MIKNILAVIGVVYGVMTVYYFGKYSAENEAEKKQTKKINGFIDNFEKYREEIGK